MTDCYRILGVDRRASAADIRAAYLAKMKTLHPDARRDGVPGDGEASEISFAYWQLRDPDRRAEHDLSLFSAPPARGRPRSAPAERGRVKTHKARAAATPTDSGRAEPARRPRRSRRLQPLRTAAGIAACLVAGAGFIFAFNGIDMPADAQAHPAPPPDAQGTQMQAERRVLDPAFKEAAATTFQETVRRGGMVAAHQHARQCLMELTAHPTMSMLDYCVAFDDLASAWEAARDTSERRYFAEMQRFGRYQSVVRGLQPGPIREAMLADVEYFAAR